jgi:arabinan endo-1,5-alpha-L-arabinosidase
MKRIFNHIFLNKKTIRILFFITLFFLFVNKDTFAQQKIPAHDPVMIRHNDVFYLFCTGWGIGTWSSIDMINWQREKPVFDKPPKWAIKAIPGFKGHIWAPDISFFMATMRTTTGVQNSSSENWDGTMRIGRS